MTQRKSKPKFFTVPVGLFLAVIFICLPSRSFGGGFIIYNQDAAASGMGLAFTAQADNPSAVFFNPAAINRLDGTRVSFGSTILMPQTSFKSDMTGKTSDMENHIYLLPNIFLTHKINDKFSAGIGMFSPFGLQTDWPKNWEGRYISTFASLRSLFINPVVSWQAHPKLSLAFGVDFVFSDIEQKKALSFRPLPVPDGRTKLHADGVSGGYNVALLYHVNRIIDLGISYRSKVKVKYRGDVTNKQVPDFLAPYAPKGEVTVDIDLPPILATGIAAALTENLTVEADLFWIGWSTYDTLKADFEEPVRKAFAKFVAPVPRDYHDVLTYSFGLKYRLKPDLVLRAGYMYDTSPVPEKTVDPILPDADRNEISVGIGFTRNPYTLDLTYYAVLVKDRKVTNNINDFNGKYESFVNLIALNLGYKF